MYVLQFSIILWFTDARVYFNRSSYTITEGEGQLEICVAIDEELGVTVDIALFSQDDTAEGTCHCMNKPIELVGNWKW